MTSLEPPMKRWRSVDLTASSIEIGSFHGPSSFQGSGGGRWLPSSVEDGQRTRLDARALEMSRNFAFVSFFETIRRNKSKGKSTGTAPKTRDGQRADGGGRRMPMALALAILSIPVFFQRFGPFCPSQSSSLVVLW